MGYLVTCYKILLLPSIHPSLTSSTSLFQLLWSHYSGCYLTLRLSSKVRVIPVQFPTTDQYLLPLPSKVLERIIHNCLMNYLLSNNVLSPHQFGFHPGSSTQEALLYATNDWHQHTDYGLSVALVFLPLQSLRQGPTQSAHLYSCQHRSISPLLTWFHSYRSQRVVLDGHSSTVHAVTSAVPRGSILGPLLFSIYMNSLANISIS